MANILAHQMQYTICPPTVLETTRSICSLNITNGHNWACVITDIESETSFLHLLYYWLCNQVIQHCISLLLIYHLDVVHW